MRSARLLALVTSRLLGGCTDRPPLSPEDEWAETGARWEARPAARTSQYIRRNRPSRHADSTPAMSAFGRDVRRLPGGRASEGGDEISGPPP